MAAGREQAAAPGVFANVPPELPVPGADPVIVVDFAIVNLAQQTLVEEGYDGEKLAGVAALKAYTSLDSGCLDGLTHGHAILPGKGERFFDNQVFAGLGRRDGLPGMGMWIAANGDGVQVWFPQHFLEVFVPADSGAVFGAEAGRIQGAGGTDASDLGQRGRIERVDVRPRCPAVTNHTDVVLFHECQRNRLRRLNL